MKYHYVVLSDGETFSPLEGCQLLTLSQEAEDYLQMEPIPDIQDARDFEEVLSEAGFTDAEDLQTQSLARLLEPQAIPPFTRPCPVKIGTTIPDAREDVVVLLSRALPDLGSTPTASVVLCGSSQHYVVWTWVEQPNGGYPIWGQREHFGSPRPGFGHQDQHQALNKAISAFWSRR